MKPLPFLISLTVVFALSAARGEEDTQPPVIDVGSIAPALGDEAPGSTVVVSGTVTDSADAGTAGIERVQYRLQGNRHWRRAILTAQDSPSTTFIFTFKIKKGENKRFYVRAFDLCRNESDSIGRRVFRPRVQPREPATGGGDPGDGTDPGDGGGGPVVTPTSTQSTAQSTGTPGFLTQDSPSLTNVPAAEPADRSDYTEDETFPTAKPVTRSANIVVSPYFPRVELDVTGFSTGDLALDPRNGQPFLVP